MFSPFRSASLTLVFSIALFSRCQGSDLVGPHSRSLAASQTGRQLLQTASSSLLPVVIPVADGGLSVVGLLLALVNTPSALLAFLSDSAGHLAKFYRQAAVSQCPDTAGWVLLRTGDQQQLLDRREQLQRRGSPQRWHLCLGHHTRFWVCGGERCHSGRWSRRLCSCAI